MRYYVNLNKQSNGDNEVHTATCNWLPEQHNREYLGDYSSCAPAVTEAKRRGYNANGCYYCCNKCHTK